MLGAQHIIAYYTLLGYFPERDYVYVCTGGEEDLQRAMNLVSRWAVSRQLRREGVSYTLAHTERIAFGDQVCPTGDDGLDLLSFSERAPLSATLPRRGVS